jgi:hypothetical protein
VNNAVQGFMQSHSDTFFVCEQDWHVSGASNLDFSGAAKQSECLRGSQKRVAKVENEGITS